MANEDYWSTWWAEPPHSDTVRDLAIGQWGFLYSASDDGTVAAFDRETGERIGTWDEVDLGSLRAVSVTSDYHVYIGGTAGTLLRTGKPDEIVEGEDDAEGLDNISTEFGDGSGINALAINYESPDRLFAVGYDGYVRAYSPNLEKQHWEKQVHESGEGGDAGRGAVAVELAEDGETLFSAGHNGGTVLAQDPGDGEILWEVSLEDEGAGKLMDLALAGDRVVAVGAEGGIFELDVDTGEVLHTLLDEDDEIAPIGAIDAHPDLSSGEGSLEHYTTSESAVLIEDHEESVSSFWAMGDGHIQHIDAPPELIPEILGADHPTNIYHVSDEDELRAALADADGLAEDALKIWIDGEITVSESLTYDLDVDLKIQAVGSEAALLGDGSGRLLDVTGAPEKVEIDGVDLRDGSADHGGGGAIRAGSTGELHLYGLNIENNEAMSGYGGAVQARSVIAEQVHFNDNEAVAGGAIHQNGWSNQSLELHEVVFEGNEAITRGGAIKTRRADLNFENVLAYAGNDIGNDAGIEGDFLYERLAGHTHGGDISGDSLGDGARQAEYKKILDVSDGSDLIDADYWDPENIEVLDFRGEESTLTVTVDHYNKLYSLVSGENATIELGGYDGDQVEVEVVADDHTLDLDSNNFMIHADDVNQLGWGNFEGVSGDSVLMDCSENRSLTIDGYNEDWDGVSIQSPDETIFSLIVSTDAVPYEGGSNTTVLLFNGDDSDIGAPITFDFGDHSEAFGLSLLGYEDDDKFEDMIVEGFEENDYNSILDLANLVYHSDINRVDSVGTVEDDAGQDWLVLYESPDGNEWLAIALEGDKLDLTNVTYGATEGDFSGDIDALGEIDMSADGKGSLVGNVNSGSIELVGVDYDKLTEDDFFLGNYTYTI
ncbi:hypothetical protein HH1059_12570 [Halorhodospira halochloris]|uniref:Pyrrolo-quinoline quinone repeat domain-containing protein n=1 Tax=Halorhodospira halochloris TaxID=1052 RepID=A0A0X8XAC0_HALHR|nr:PQQ-binding-like beta-propeller repeat protein [Halorhodospira halochloris]MBK1652043.1 hypothetical protein [Halorhodospira halochloris]BAU57962.1 hypothetical protein HH1059_12570 [Halorhodospira halochloris]